MTASHIIAHSAELGTVPGNNEKRKGDKEIMLEIAEFKPEDIDGAIEGMDGLQQIIVPLLRKANYQGMAEQDIQQFLRHITLAKHALVAMWDYLEGKMQSERKNRVLTLDELRQMEGRPVWIKVLDRSDLSRWHFIVKTEELGLIAKDGLGAYENGKLSGCYFDVEHGHNYGINWIAFARKPEEG